MWHSRSSGLPAHHQSEVVSAVSVVPGKRQLGGRAGRVRAFNRRRRASRLRRLAKPLLPLDRTTLYPHLSLIMLTKRLLVSLFAASAFAEPLLTVLQANGLNDFAQWLQADPPFNPDAAGRRLIIYAPIDPFLAQDSNLTITRRKTPKERRERERKKKAFHFAN